MVEHFEVGNTYTHPGFLDVTMKVVYLTTEYFMWVHFYNTRGLFVAADTVRIPSDMRLWIRYEKV